MDPIPPSRYPAQPIDQAKFRWWVAKVKPRQEKQLAFDFIKSGIEYYLPLHNKVTFRPGTNKKRVSTVPLFPGYICFAQETPKDIFVTGRVVNLIEIKNQKRFISELSSLYSAIELGYSVEPITQPYTINSRVEVVSGLLKGLQGVVSSIKNQASLIIDINGLGAAAIHINMSEVRVLSTEQG
ncbi:MAG: hypothetical protein GX640_03475 [Fibrobacter sp.]|nr:hypothetical protein [Fibrobacter sp.]